MWAGCWEDVGVGEEVEGRWTTVTFMCHVTIFAYIRGMRELCIGKLNKWYTRYTLLLVFYRLKLSRHHWDQAVMFTSKWSQISRQRRLQGQPCVVSPV